MRRRVLKADGVPVQLADTYYPADLAADTELAKPGKLQGYTVAALRRLGIDVDHFHDELQLRMPTYAADDRPVEVADQLLAGDRHILSYDMPAHATASEESTR